MNRNFTTKDTICIGCKCKGQRFLHNLWCGNDIERVCSSCVLFKYDEFFCPTCFAVHDYPSDAEDTLIRCDECSSYSHPICFSSNGKSSGKPSLCSTCRDPHRLILRLRESNDESGSYQLMEKPASLLLLTAAKIAKMLMSELSNELDTFSEKKGSETLEKRKIATLAVNNTIRLANKCKKQE